MPEQLRDFAYWVSEHRGSTVSGEHLKGRFTQRYADDKILVEQEGGHYYRTVKVHVCIGGARRKVFCYEARLHGHGAVFYRPGLWEHYLCGLVGDPNGVPIDDEEVFTGA